MSDRILGLTEDEWKIMFLGPNWTEEVNEAMSGDDFSKALEIHKRNIEAEWQAKQPAAE